ncbi:MAG: fibronectin type III domain-containing protein [Fervidobacterium sp.]|uniref:fibronectin type III domain-containing protein n=1 Tax=Fervidobacterium sp. TaxID=1871331 RepID=UPI00404ADE2B
MKDFKLLEILLFLFVLLLASCTYSPKPEFGNISYDGRTYTDFTTAIEVVRSKQITVNMKTQGAYAYTYKLDGISLESATTTNFITLKNYNAKLNLTKEFFNNQHVLAITVAASGRNTTIEVPIKIQNQKPAIEIKKKSDTEISISIVEPDGDQIKFKSVKLYKDGKEVGNIAEGIISVTGFTQGVYRIVAQATDEFDEVSQEEYSFEIKESGGIQEENKPPKITILQPFMNEITPSSLVLRFHGKDENTGDVLTYDVEVAEYGSSEEILRLQNTKSTEIIVPNLKNSTTYVATVTVYDTVRASATDWVVFTTNLRERYLYTVGKDFSGKGMIAILKATALDSLNTVGSFVYDSEITDFDVVEDYIYAISGRRLIIVNARDKSEPIISNEISFDSNLSVIRVYKNYAIVGVGYDKIEVLNLTIPSSPTYDSYRFSEKTFSYKLPTLKTRVASTNSLKMKDSIDITQGRINDIVLFADKAYIAADLGGIFEMDLSSIPNLTIRDIKNVIPGDYSTLDIGIFDGKYTLAYGSGCTAGIVNIPISSSSVTPVNFDFDTPVRKVKIHDEKMYILTMDKFYVWDGSTVRLIKYMPSSSLMDFYFSQDYCFVFDESKGLWTFRLEGGSYKLYEPNKVYRSVIHQYNNKFIFLIGDGFVDEAIDSEGLYAVDVRDPRNPVVRDKIIGNFSKLKINPYVSNPTVGVLSDKTIILYSFSMSTLNFSTLTSLDLSSYAKVYDFVIDGKDNMYVLANDGTNNIVARYMYDTTLSLDKTITLPNTIDQDIPYFSGITELVEPYSIELVIDTLSKSKDVISVLVALGSAGSMRLSANLNEQKTILTRYYLVTESQSGGYTLKKYNPGNDLKIISDKYFDRLFVADGEYNGVWILDKNGVNLIGGSEDNLTSTPLFEGAPARDVTWYADKVFVACGSYGYKIIDVFSKSVIADVRFSGMTYAFSVSSDGKYLYASTDNGLIIYDISTISNPQPLFTLSMPMMKVLGR